MYSGVTWEEARLPFDDICWFLGGPQGELLFRLPDILMYDLYLRYHGFRKLLS